MYIKNINLKNYRNYADLSIDLTNGVNIFYGQNAQGKTNIIESIYLLSTGRSHRSQKDSELINWNSDESKAELNYERDNVINSLEIHLKKNNKKQIKVNGVRLKKTGDLLGNLLTVIFSPDHMKIIKEGPAERRRFIDIILSQVKPGYYYNLLQYMKVLEQRNNLLNEAWNNKELLKTIDIWDNQLIEYGCKIIKERINFISSISEIAKKTHSKITNEKENLRIIYRSSFDVENDNLESIKKAYENKLNNSRSSDIRRGVTQSGPHRDDILLFINDKEVKVFGSQGQQRTALLSLKLSELEFLNNESDSYPILLLDDVFSELDTQRQTYLMDFVKDIQTIITCTDVAYFKSFNIGSSYIFKVCEGRVERNQ